MFNHEFSQGRAALRYANVDKEEFESYISLSSCRSEGGGKKSSHRKSHKKSSRDFSNGKNAASFHKSMLSQMHGGTLAQLGSKHQQEASYVCRQINNFLTLPTGSSIKSSSRKRDEKKHFQRANQAQHTALTTEKKQNPRIQVQPLGDLNAISSGNTQAAILSERNGSKNANLIQQNLAADGVDYALMQT